MPAAPALRITADDLASVTPPVPRAPAPPTPPPRQRLRTSRLALAAFFFSVLGLLPLAGFVTGSLGILLGSLSLGEIRQSGRRGFGWALASVLLGLVGLVEAVAVAAWYFSGGAPTVFLRDFEPDLTSVANLEPKLARAMRANVLVRWDGGWRGGLGSGVILHLADGWATVLTNRHVADPNFAATPGRVEDHRSNLKVTALGQAAMPAQLIWVAPDNIDLALVKTAYAGQEARAAQRPAGKAPKVGDPVFAVGNPHGLDWTYTQGFVSQFRFQNSGQRRVRVIQTQTSINPGNSGGGLYDDAGRLIGIATWTQDKRVSEGLNFAIDLEPLWDLFPADLVPPAEPEAP